MTRKGIHDSSSKLEDSENKLIFEKVEKTNGIVRIILFYILKYDMYSKIVFL